MERKQFPGRRELQVRDSRTGLSANDIVRGIVRARIQRNLSEFWPWRRTKIHKSKRRFSDNMVFYRRSGTWVARNCFLSRKISRKPKPAPFRKKLCSLRSKWRTFTAHHIDVPSNDILASFQTTRLEQSQRKSESFSPTPTSGGFRSKSGAASRLEIRD